MSRESEKIFRKPSFWQCETCQRILQHGEFRFNCIECPDYDQCEACATNSQSAHEHRMVREIAYGYVEQAEYTADNLTTRIRSAILTYRDRFCMGTRDRGANEYLDSYSWQTFQTIGTRIINFSHGLRRLAQPRDFLGICAANRPEWLITDFACILQSLITVPIYSFFNDREVAHIVQNSSISIVVCDGAMLPKFLRLRSQCPSLRHLICFDAISESKPGTSGLGIHSMQTIERYGSVKQYEFIPTEPDECITVIYTSGSSGFPKGAIISERAFRNNFPPLNLSFRNEHVKLCYRPLAWATDRLGCIAVFLGGGRVGFATGDVNHLMEELALVRPTSFSGPPTIWNKIYSEYRAALASITAGQSKDDMTKNESMLLLQFAKLIPNRCKTLSIGGAMVSPVVLDFMKRCFSQCRILESYGTTECGSIAFDQLLENEVNYRLESVTEMGYTVDDEPFPRGELVIKTQKMFSGYLNNPDETTSAFTDDGYFRTGDIVELRPGENVQPTIRVIDRRKNFFKLSQGQFVSPEFLEEIYRKSPFVEQVYVYGNPFDDSVRAAIVPNVEHIRAFANKPDLNEVTTVESEKVLHDVILEDIQSLARKESLRQHEIPSKLVISFEAFTPENGFLTPSMKLCRHRLAARFNNRVKNLLDKATAQQISLGGDSLAAIRLSRLIHDHLGVSVPLSYLLQPNLTPEGLAAIIENPSSTIAKSDSIGPRLIQDAAQDLGIEIGATKSFSSDLPSLIFITGTSGFVGGFLLAELLKTYSSECKFVCLVRCEESTHPLDRIQQNMIFLQLWKDEFQDRLIALRGDLAQERFGLNEQTYSDLAQRTDLIFHCGAIVNFILPYEQLYRSNVSGTREVIRYATHWRKCIPIQYVSTMSVLPSTTMHSETSIDEISPDHLRTGYAQSKWVAEKLIVRASRLGVPVTIYRLGSVWADTETGACNQHDIHSLLLAAVIKTGCYPATSSKVRLNGLPANWAAERIVLLSRVESNTIGQIYDIACSDNGIPFQCIINSVQECGMKLRSVSTDEWKLALKRTPSVEQRFEVIVELFSTNPFEKIVARQTFDTNCTFPPLNNNYFVKWVKFISNYIVDEKPPKSVETISVH